MIILEENFKWHLEAFASKLFIYIYTDVQLKNDSYFSMAFNAFNYFI